MQDYKHLGNVLDVINSIIDKAANKNSEYTKISFGTNLYLEDTSLIFEHNPSTIPIKIDDTVEQKDYDDLISNTFNVFNTQVNPLIIYNDNTPAELLSGSLFESGDNFS